MECANSVAAADYASHLATARASFHRASFLRCYYRTGQISPVFTVDVIYLQVVTDSRRMVILAMIECWSFELPTPELNTLRYST